MRVFDISKCVRLKNAVMSLTVSLKHIVNSLELRIPDGGEDVLPPAAHLTESHIKAY